MEENARNFIDAFIQEDIAEGGQFFHTNWTGEGGNTTAGTYNT